MKELGKKSLCEGLGFVNLIDIMGSDEKVVYSARQSTKNQKSSRTDEQNRHLIRYLFRNEHISPWEQCALTFEARLPIFVVRQLVRHQVIRLNEQSARYAEMSDDWYLPSAFFDQHSINYQRSSDSVAKGSDKLLERYLDSFNKSHELYKDAISQGISKEDARINLPVAMMTNFVFTISLRGFFHVLELRMHEHAQHQTVEFAEAIFDLVKEDGSFKWSLEIFYEVVKLRWLFKDLLNKYDKDNNDDINLNSLYERMDMLR